MHSSTVWNCRCTSARSSQIGQPTLTTYGEKAVPITASGQSPHQRPPSIAAGFWRFIYPNWAWLIPILRNFRVYPGRFTHSELLRHYADAGAFRSGRIPASGTVAGRTDVLIDRATEFSNLVDLPAYLARSALTQLFSANRKCAPIERAAR